MSQPIDEATDVMEVTMEGTNEQTPWAIVRHYRPTAVNTPETWLSMVFDYWHDTIVAALEPITTTLWVAECITITRAAPGPRNAFYQGFVPAVVGDVSTDGLPPQMAALARLVSDEPGRSQQGRVYLCGVPEASTNGGVLLASVQAAWQAAADLFAATITVGANTAVPVVFSRTKYDPAAAPPQPVADYVADITAAELQGNIATQRRRRVRRSSFSA